MKDATGHDADRADDGTASTSRPVLARLDPEEFIASAQTLAQRLLGRALVRRVGRELLVGEIVETEAYLGPRDLASHTRGGLRSRRNASMWRGGGVAYVYLVYGMHHCFNVVAGEPDSGAAVLIRAVRPLLGIKAMSARRGLSLPSPRASEPATEPMLRSAGGRLRGPTTRPPAIANGPARLTQAMAIGPQLDGEDLRSSRRIWIAEHGGAATDVAATARIGVAFAGAWASAPLRFVRANAAPFLSRPLANSDAKSR